MLFGHFADGCGGESFWVDSSQFLLGNSGHGVIGTRKWLSPRNRPIGRLATAIGNPNVPPATTNTTIRTQHTHLINILDSHARMPSARIPFARLYSSATAASPKSPYRSFWYQHGTPLLNCTLIASATAMGLHLLWSNLDYAEYRNEVEATVKTLETRVRELEQAGGKKT